MENMVHERIQVLAWQCKTADLKSDEGQYCGVSVHPSHSLDLVPSDFHLFGPLEAQLSSKWFEDELPDENEHRRFRTSEQRRVRHSGKRLSNRSARASIHGNGEQKPLNKNESIRGKTKSERIIIAIRLNENVEWIRDERGEGTGFSLLNMVRTRVFSRSDRKPGPCAWILLVKYVQKPNQNISPFNPSSWRVGRVLFGGELNRKRCACAPSECTRGACKVHG
ncbi:hypothetical protein Trydic_g20481 [Trypoxylus dichotomus]